MSQQAEKIGKPATQADRLKKKSNFGFTTAPLQIVGSPNLNNPIDHIEEPEPDLDLCKRKSDCHRNAKCIFDQLEQKRVCKCDEFYVGDGFNSCSPGPGNI